MKNTLTFTLLTTAAALQLGCSGDTIIIVQQAPDTGVTPTPVEDAGAPVTTADAAADGGEGTADATVSDAGAADAATVDAGYDAGFNRLSDGGYAYNPDAAICGGRFVVMQMPADDPMGLGRLLSPPDVMFTLKPSPPLTQSEAAAWCAARGAQLPLISEAQYLGANGVSMNQCPEVWQALADAGVGPCSMWLDNVRDPNVNNTYISNCMGGRPRVGTAPLGTICVYR